MWDRYSQHEFAMSFWPFDTKCLDWSKEAGSLEKTSSLVFGFIGYTVGAYGIQRAQISLELYRDPTHIARFLAFLKVSE